MSEQNLTEKIAQKIFMARKAFGMTQKQVASLLGISEGQFAHYEKGRAEPSINLIYQMCLLFNASFDEWLGISKKPIGINDIEPILETTNTALNSSTLQDNYLDTKKSPIIQISEEAIEVAEAYDNAPFKDKNMARMALNLPLLETEVKEIKDSGNKGEQVG